MRFTDLLLDSVPWKKQILRTGARVLPSLRTNLAARGLSALARRIGDTSEIETNMGIDRHLKCSLPLDKGSWIFGRPEQYIGERGALELVAALGKRSDGVMDIGAHVGYYTYFLAKRLSVETPIYFFEPDPALFDIVDRNVRANRLHNVVGFREAMGAVSELSTFYQNQTDSFSGSLEQTFVGMHATASIDVQVRSFDDFSRSIDKKNLCVKVDIEGAEQQFVDGAKSEWGRISDLVIEILGPAYYSGFVQKLLQSTGMHAYHINDYELCRCVDGSFTPSAQDYNWLFTRKSVSELRDAIAGTRLRIRE